MANPDLCDSDDSDSVVYDSDSDLEHDTSTNPAPVPVSTMSICRDHLREWFGDETLAFLTPSYFEQFVQALESSYTRAAASHMGRDASEYVFEVASDVSLALSRFFNLGPTYVTEEDWLILDDLVTSILRRTYQEFDDVCEDFVCDDCAAELAAEVAETLAIDHHNHSAPAA